MTPTYQSIVGRFAHPIRTEKRARVSNAKTVRHLTRNCLDSNAGVATKKRAYVEPNCSVADHLKAIYARRPPERNVEAFLKTVFGNYGFVA